ncbi:MAG: tRNA (adenosine(37)-N6)-threonylcarbamoyltransferase complex dimerization subunit type 1 TsaB [Planctomycetota bacterium]
MTAPSPITLGFDTSGPYCSAATLQGDTCLAAVHEDMTRGQAEQLMPLLEQCLREADLTWAQIDRIGVGVGPGNFTGIRIAVSAARGLALGLGKPAFGVSLLEACAYGTDGPRLAALSAPRGQAYVQGFAGAAPASLTLIDVETAELVITPGTACIGSAAAPLADRLGLTHRPAAFAPGSAVARIAARVDAATAGPPTPLYVRPADAAPPRDAPPTLIDG